MRRRRENFRFSHSKMMISIAKSIENHAQKPKFSPAALIQNQTPISESLELVGNNPPLFFQDFEQGGLFPTGSSKVCRRKF